MKKIMLFMALGLSLFAFDIKQIEPTCKNPNKQTECLDQIFDAWNKKLINSNHFNAVKNLCLKSNSAGACAGATILADYGSEEEFRKIGMIDIMYKVCNLKPFTNQSGVSSYYACFESANLAIMLKDKKSAINFSNKACKAGRQDGCALYKKLTQAPQAKQSKQARIKELKAKAAELEKRANAASNSQAYHDLKEQASDYRARAIALEIGGENAEASEDIIRALEQTFGGY